MQKIILDFGTVDVSAYAGTIWVFGVAMAAILGFVWGQLAPWRAWTEGQDPRRVLHWGGYLLGAGILLAAGSRLGWGIPLHLCAYPLLLAVGFLVGAGLAIRRGRQVAKQVAASGGDLRETRAPRLTIASPACLTWVSVPALLAAGALLGLDAIGFTMTLRIYGYGLMLVLGFLSAMALAQWRARRAGENPEHIPACGMLALIGGVVGARGAYIIENWSRFAREPNRLGAIVDVTSGGLIYYGGVALATAMVLVYLRARRLPIRRYLDLLAASLMVGLGFGRAGCTLNGCCYGARCRADWALHTRFPMYSRPLIKLDGRDNPFSAGTESPSATYAAQMDLRLGAGRVRPPELLLSETGSLIPPREFTPEQVALAAAQKSLPVKPAQLLGMLNAFLLAGLLTAFHRLRTREGQAFAALMVIYPVTRFILETIRADNIHDLAALVLTHNQYVSLAIVLAGLALWLVLYKLPSSAGPTEGERQLETLSSCSDGGSARQPGKRRERGKRGRS